MKFLGHRVLPKWRVREMLRERKWKKALAELERVARTDERNYAAWNAVGDLHFRCKSSPDAVKAWSHAAEGYAREGLYENALALTRKTLRMVPERADLHLTLAELYLAMGYHADSLVSLRTYLRLCTDRSEQGLRAFFRKIVESNLHLAHLLEEVLPLFRDAKIEDQELQTELEKFVTLAKEVAAREEPAEMDSQVEGTPPESRSRDFGGTPEGLVTLDAVGEGSEPFEQGARATFASETSEIDLSAESVEKKSSESRDDADLPIGEGRDHYDLGMLYQEMKLWDAAVNAFEQARRDASLRFKASLGLAECVMAKGDPRQALELLENFEQSEEQPLEDRLRLEFLRGEIHEALGNLSQALAIFENIHGQHADFRSVEERIRGLKERMTQEETQ